MPRASRPDPLDVAVLTYDGLCTFEFGIACEVFALPRPELESWYRFSVCSMDQGPIRTTGGVFMNVQKALGRLDRAGTIVIPGWRDVTEVPPADVLRRLRRCHERGARFLSVCSGVFVLAAAGLLDGRRATTHWRYADALARRHPEVTVDPDVLYVDEGDVLTSAGSAAGIDLCLHLVRRDFGTRVANVVARRLVVPPHRDGGQAQFVDAPVAPEKGDGLSELLDWLRRHLRKPHTVASMARRARTSERTLARRFRQTVGMSPHAWLTRERVRRAELLLETTDHGVERIAGECGLGSAQLLRVHFRQILGTTPTAYRRTFRR